MNQLEFLSTRNITKYYASHKALDGVSIDVPKQSIYGLLGPNGAGKSTLIRIINQIITYDEGEVFLEGEQLHPGHIRKIGYLPEERGLYKKMKLGEQLVYLGQLRGLSKKEAVNKGKAWVDRLELTNWWNKNIEDLSKGMAQKVQFIATVMHEPALIILDEPFSGFDPINADLIKNEILALRDRGCTVVFSTHRMESVEQVCDHLALVHQSKKILEGPKSVIKETFKTNTYTIRYKGELGPLNEAHFMVRKFEAVEGVQRAEISATEQGQANYLLRLLVDQVEVSAFEEKLPSINDIFIQKVKEGSNA